MLPKTHFAIGIFAVVFFLPHIEDKFIFAVVTLIATILPDIDSGFSSLGNKGVFKPLKFIKKHRGIFHSFTLCIVVSFVFALYLPVLAFGFFLGYALHLLADSWTPEGIRPFWPSKHLLKGRVTGVLEETVFMVFAVLDVVFLILLFV